MYMPATFDVDCISAYLVAVDPTSIETRAYYIYFLAYRQIVIYRKRSDLSISVIILYLMLLIDKSKNLNCQNGFYLTKLEPRSLWVYVRALEVNCFSL